MKSIYRRKLVTTQVSANINKVRDYFLTVDFSIFNDGECFLFSEWFEVGMDWEREFLAGHLGTICEKREKLEFGKNYSNSHRLNCWGKVLVLREMVKIPLPINFRGYRLQIYYPSDLNQLAYFSQASYWWNFQLNASK